MLQVPTGAIMYTVGASVRAREATFVHSNNDTGMLAVHAGSETVFEAQDCSFVGWVGSNVVGAGLGLVVTGWFGMGCDAMGCEGMGCHGVGWGGMGWDGMRCDGDGD